MPQRQSAKNEFETNAGNFVRAWLPAKAGPRNVKHEMSSMNANFALLNRLTVLLLLQL